jgi:hypothetical protein
MHHGLSKPSYFKTVSKDQIVETAVNLMFHKKFSRHSNPPSLGYRCLPAVRRVAMLAFGLQ